MKETFNQLAEIFQLNGTVTDYSVISNGNINNTYDVTVEIEGEPRHFVFQKVNIYVFKNPKRIMKNIAKITHHIADKLEEQGQDRDQVMHFATRENGKNYYTEKKHIKCNLQCSKSFQAGGIYTNDINGITESRNHNKHSSYKIHTRRVVRIVKHKYTAQSHKKT